MKITFEKAVQLLKSGQNVAIPTETVYGLAAALHSEVAIDAIFRLKRRPRTNPLIVHVADLNMCSEFIRSMPKDFEKLSQHFWPGPLTLIAEVLEEKIPDAVRAGLSTCAFRIPQHPLTLELLKRTGPLVAPSCNLSGKPSATSKEHVESDFGKDFPVLDDGLCTHGVESTICSFQDGSWKIARKGAISSEQLSAVLGYSPEFCTDPKQPICPGQHFRHYAPNAKLILVKTPWHELKQKPEYVLGFFERLYQGAKKVIYLGSITDPMSVAKNLYHNLRHLDDMNIDTVWVDYVLPDDGLWSTIKERIQKASK